MTFGPAVPQNPSGRWLIALRRHHEGGAVVRSSANACLSAYRETPQACLGFRPAAFESFVIFRPHADAPIPVGSHRQADSSDGRRTVGRERECYDSLTHVVGLRSCTSWQLRRSRNISGSKIRQLVDCERRRLSHDCRGPTPDASEAAADAVPSRPGLDSPGQPLLVAYGRKMPKEVKLLSYSAINLEVRRADTPEYMPSFPSLWSKALR
jgi:hypothetical protein